MFRGVCQKFPLVRDKVDWMTLEGDMKRLRSLLFRSVSLDEIEKLYFEALLVAGNMGVMRDHLRDNPKFLEIPK